MLLPGAAVERVAVAGRHRAGLVDDDHERDVRLLLAVAHAHVDRQRLLERRLLVAAGAVAVLAADHHQPLAEVADVDLEGGQLLVVQPDARDVDEHDAVVGGEPGEVARQRLGDHRVDLLALRLERGDQLAGDLVVPGEDQRPRLALDDGVRVGAVVLAEGVAGGLDDGPERVEAGLGGLDVEGDPRDARLELDRLRGDQRPVGEQPDGRRLGDRGADLGDRLDRFAEPRDRRRREPLDEHLVDVAEADRLRLDADAAARRERRLGRPAAGRVVAVAEEDDPLLRVVGEEGGGEAQRGADVGGALDRRRGDAVDVLELGREPLDERVLAERDDPGDVALRLLLERLAQERERLAASRVADRVRQVDDEDRREPVDRQHQLEPGDREDEGAQQDASGPPARSGDGPRPSAAARRGGGRSSARAPGPAAGARAAR